jgi:putative DNA primase/helicase
MYTRLDVSNLQNIPTELLGYKSWICWREDPPRTPGAKAVKMPIIPGTTRKADTTGPQTWNFHEGALSAYTNTPRLAGIGWVFSKDDPYTGIDLDKCRNPETGVIESWAMTLIHHFNSYSEISPSQTGVKILVRGNLVGKPPGERGRFKTVWRDCRNG